MGGAGISKRLKRSYSGLDINGLYIRRDGIPPDLIDTLYFRNFYTRKSELGPVYYRYYEHSSTRYPLPCHEKGDFKKRCRFYILCSTATNCWYIFNEYAGRLYQQPFRHDTWDQSRD